MDIQTFFAELRGKRVAVVGIGISNTGLISLFGRKGAVVSVHDRRSREEIGEIVGTLEAEGVKLCLGEGYLDNLETDIVVRTPGMPFLRGNIDELRERGVVVTSEMEMFFDLCPCKIIAVTGSDGKTTTTTLIAKILTEQGYTVHLGGNLGRALLPEVEKIKPSDIAVVELSSFQLVSMRRSPDIAVITNVAPNHLDIHKDMAEYIDAKKNVYAHQNAFSLTVLNADNDITRSFAREVRGRLRWFSLEKAQESGAYLDTEGMICYSDNGKVTQIMKAADIRIPGIHNVANYLGVIAAIKDLVSDEKIVKVAKEFGGVEHRIEFVRELDGVRWYNDSIATSPTRAIAGLKSFSQKLTVIAGGYDKKIPFEPLAPYIVECVRLLILTGHTADKIEKAVRSCESYKEGYPRIMRAADVAEAVQIARENTTAGDVVTLSPACASFDAYANFEARGRHFKELVARL